MDNSIYLIIEFISGILAFLYIINSFLSLGKYHFDFSKIEIYYNNWNTPPITNVLISSSEICPNNYEYLISNSFPGNFKGCNCYLSKSPTYENKILFNKTCTENELNNNCYDIVENDIINLKYWRNKTICIRRMNNNYWDLYEKKLIRKKNCPENYISCGKIDTFGNLLCLNKNETCPISSFDIINNDNLNRINENYNKLTLNDNYTIIYSNNNYFKGNNSVNFFTNTHSMCYEPMRGLFGQNRYTLNKLKGERFCSKKSIHDDIYNINNNNNSYYDGRFNTIDKYESNIFYEENNLTNLIRNFSVYPPILTIMENNLFSINYFGIDEKCMIDSSDIKINKEKLFFPNVSDNRNIIGIICLCSCFYLFTCFISFGLYCFLEDSKNKQRIFYFIDIIKLIILISIIITLSIIISKNNKIMEENKSFGKNCVEKITKKSFDSAYKNIKKSNKSLITILIFSIIDLIIRIIYYILYLIKI